MCNVLILKAPIKVIKPSRNSTDERVKEKGLKDTLSPLHNLLVIFTRRLKTISQYRLLIIQGMSVHRWISKTGNLINRAKVCKPERYKGKHSPCRLYSVHDCNRMEVLPLNTWNSQWMEHNCIEKTVKSGHRLRINMLGAVAHVWLRERQRGSELKQVFSSCYTVTATHRCTVKSTENSYLPCLSPKCKETRLYCQCSICTFCQV